jgi:hypothetical protein
MNIPNETFFNGINLEMIQNELSKLTNHISYIHFTDENGFYDSNILKLFPDEESCIDYIVELITDDDTVEIVSKIESDFTITMKFITVSTLLNIEKITNTVRICNLIPELHQNLIYGLKIIRTRWPESKWKIDGVEI